MLLKCTKNQYKTTSSYTHNYPSQKRTCVLNRSSKAFKCLPKPSKVYISNHIKRQISPTPRLPKEKEETNRPIIVDFLFSVIPLRFERRTHALEGRCSIQLSYGTILNKYAAFK